MKPHRKVLKGTIVVLAAGAALGLGTHFLSVGPAYADEQTPKVPQDALRVANELSTAFEYSADAVRPSVVSIQATKRMKPATQFHWSMPLPGGENTLPFGISSCVAFLKVRFPTRTSPSGDSVAA